MNASRYLQFFIIILVVSLIQSEYSDAKREIKNLDEKKIEEEIRVASSFINNNEDSAKYYLKKIDIITRPLPNQFQRGKFFLVLGNYYLFHSKISAAEESYRKVLEIANHIDNGRRSLLVQPALYSLGNLATRKGKYLEGIKYFLENEQQLLTVQNVNELSKKQDFSYLRHILCNNYFALCTIYFSLSNQEKSSYYLNKTYPYLSRYSDTLYYFVFKGMLSNGKQGRYYFTKALDKAIHAKDSTAIKENLSNIGLTLLAEKEYKKAIDYAYKSINIKLNLDDTDPSNYQNYYILGISYLFIKKYGDAEKFLKKALVYYQLKQDKNYEYRTLFYLRDLYVATGNHKKALSYFTRAQSVKDSLIGINKQNQIAQLGLDFELSTKQKELENEHKFEILIFIILTILALLLLSTIVAYFRIKNTRDLLATQKKIVEQQAIQLSKANATKDKLFIIIGHDLRRPINNLVNFLYLLEDDYVVSPSYLQKLRYNLDGVQLILENLFKWAESQMRNSAPKRNPISIDLIVKNVISQLEDNCSQKEVKLINSLNGEKISGDENYLQIIFRNIISNAIKFTSKGDSIHIYSEVYANETHIIVQDTGVGIDEKQLRSIFEYPSPRTGTNNEKGSGFGLTLCRELIHKIEGDIIIQSTKDEGTSVVLIFQNA
ncbi:ATP-binding protein [Flectobacillus roseus]|uniref:histidine kinase n=1 Tax=Flectobacillus roseus TaxID=502259 RepID=A0ABT6YGL3_9BACT|nr:tetratricopeptide repeat-containing sensor histidine kinase [Flectobacillus roseus]MDI9862660.1 tetratricopeptide repeat-containing sensor histidine kinase [Flectobacillus roseus]